MNQRFTPQEISSLLANKHITRCSEKSITYRTNFKLAAVKRYHDGLSPSAIFQEAGFNLALIGRKTPKWCITRWRRIFGKKGVAGLRKDHRGRHSGGRPPNLAFKNDQEKLTYLEAENTYLKAENAFLAKLRKQRLNYGHASDTESSGRCSMTSPSFATSQASREADTTGGSNTPMDGTRITKAI